MDKYFAGFYFLCDICVLCGFSGDYENRYEVKFYFKLAGWFFIDTPIGRYNPDWAFVLENDTKVYFVAETKGTNNIDEEKYKIRCCKKHFDNFRDVRFEAPITKLSDILD